MKFFEKTQNANCKIKLLVDLMEDHNSQNETFFITFHQNLLVIRQNIHRKTFFGDGVKVRSWCGDQRENVVTTCLRENLGAECSEQGEISRSFLFFFYTFFKIFNRNKSRPPYSLLVYNKINLIMYNKKHFIVSLAISA